MQIKIKKIKPTAILPKYVHPGDVGLDLYSLEDYNLEPGERKVFFIGFALEFPEGYVAIVKDKSSVGGVGIITSGGVYDAGYRGEYNVCLNNISEKVFEIKKHQKIAQLLIFPVVIADLIETDKLSDSARGNGKFGSTGKF
jgi:dUTP pyrophosphatase